MRIPNVATHLEVLAAELEGIDGTYLTAFPADLRHAAQVLREYTATIISQGDRLERLSAQVIDLRKALQEIADSPHAIWRIQVHAQSALNGGAS